MDNFIEGENSKIPEQFIQIILLGNQGVGKTSILNWYSANIFHENSYPTIGADFKNLHQSHKG